MPIPAPAAPAQAQQPPMGASPVTGPTPNKGYEAAALQRVGLVSKQLTELLSLAGATTDLGKDIMKALQLLTKHVPPGSVTPAAEKNQLERMQMSNTQNNQQMQALKQQQMQGQQQGGAPGQPKAA